MNEKASAKMSSSVRNKFADALDVLSDKIKVPAPQEPKPLPKSFIGLSSDPDMPTEIQDRLYGGYIGQLRQLVLSLKAPFVLSINGPWGRGKTFLIEHVLNHEAVFLEYEVVRIDAWEVPDSEPAMPYILAQIADQLGAADGEKKKLLTAGTAVAWFGTAVSGSHPFGLALLMASWLLKKAVSEISDRSKNINNLRQRFSAMVGKQLGENKKSTLIVFIDNLDRCSPEQCIGFLDQLAKFLKTKNCIFILALDEEVVDGAIQQRYGAETSITASGYLEKIIDLSLNPPIPQTAGLIDLLGDRFEQTTKSPELRADMRNALRQFEMANIAMTSEIAQNPRKMFRILKQLSAYLHFEGIARLDKLNHMLPGLLFMSIIKTYKPIFFEALLKNPQLGTDILLLQNIGSRVSMNGYDIGSLGQGKERQERKESVTLPFADKSFIDDPECAALIRTIADDFSRRKDVYRAAGAPEFQNAVLKLITTVQGMKI